MKRYFMFIVLVVFATNTILVTSCKKDKENKAPVITLVSPGDNGVFISGTDIIFSGTAIDNEDGELTDLKWASDKDGQIGSGKSFTVKNLSVNTHVITVSAVDKNGKSTSISFKVIVQTMEISVSILTSNQNPYFEGDTIVFEAGITTTNNITIPDKNIIWKSDIDGVLGSGKKLKFNKLHSNTHKISVTATDSVFSTYSAEKTLTVVPNVITISISKPVSNLYYAQNSAVPFECSISTSNNIPVASELIVWKSDIDGQIGTGFSFNRSNLSVGKHIITVTVSDGLYQSNSITKSLSVVTAIQYNFYRMLEYMSGSFSSSNHADTTVNQYIVDVRLHMRQIWKDRNVGENIFWLYVEQAYADDLEHPYRQRVYKVMMSQSGELYDEIYSIPTPATYLHGFNNPEIFNTLFENNLTLKDNCGLNFSWNETKQMYDGATTGHLCFTTSIPGVSYITSVSELGLTKMTSWDRGYSASGAWVLGPDWPYIFDKLENYPFIHQK